MRKIYYLIKLTRPHNCLMAGIGVWLGGYLSGGSIGDLKIGLASIAAALVCGAGNSLNDFLDIEIDKVSHPNRPLPREDLPSYMAVLITTVFSIAAVILAIFINLKVLAVVIGALLLLNLYNFKLKKLPLWGNLAISLLSGATFIVGGLAVNMNDLLAPPGPVVPAIFAVLFHLGREWFKDMADLEGDKSAGLKTLPAILSFRMILIMASFLYALLIFLTLLSIYYHWYADIYEYITIFLVDLPLVILITYLWISKRKNRFGFAGAILKLLMAIGLLAFIFGKN